MRGHRGGYLGIGAHIGGDMHRGYICGYISGDIGRGIYQGRGY